MIPHGPVHVIGASGRSGLAVCRALVGAGVGVVPVVRDLGKWGVVSGGALGGLAARAADLADGGALRAALAGAGAVVCCAHARFAGAVVGAAPAGARFVFLGSTRKFTRWPDAHGLGVLAGEAAFLASGRDGVMLHPTMIYGAAGEDNVRRLAALLRRLPVVPLPGGGRALVQPIYQDDVTRCVVAALGRAWAGPRSMVIAGPVAVSYAAFVQAVARAAGLGRVRIVAVPGWVVMAGSFVTRLPGFPKVGVGEVRRLMEDKGFDVGDMREVLGVEPVGLAVGLARSFG